MKFILTVYIFAIIKICYAGSLHGVAKDKSIENTSKAYEPQNQTTLLKIWKVYLVEN